MSEMMMVIRADAGPQIGIGHVMRCLALAQAWQEMGGTATFLFAAENPALEARLIEEGMHIAHIAAQPGSAEDVQQTVRLARQKKAAWVVVDGYHFPAVYQHELKANGLQIFWIDDYGHAESYSADWVLNQNIHADESLYRNRESYTRLLLGPRYALLRQEFLAWQGWQREIPDVAGKVLVTLGGGDPDNRTLKIVQVLQQVDLDGLQVVAVLGERNSHVDELQSAICKLESARIVHNARNMPDLMAWADVAISAAGTTCWELAFMGLPALLVVTAENQVYVGKGMDQASAAIDLGWVAEVDRFRISTNLGMLLTDVERRRAMSARGRELIDGYGTERVYSALVKGGLCLRPVSPSDFRMLWNWANDPVARRMAVSIAPISFEEHVHWFEKKLAFANTVIFILERDATPVGQIRFDLDRYGEAEIDIYITPEDRGKSLGTYLLREGTRRYIKSSGERVKAVVGHIKPENIPSYCAFKKAGFRHAGIDMVQDVVLVRFVWAEGDV